MDPGRLTGKKNHMLKTMNRRHGRTKQSTAGNAEGCSASRTAAQNGHLNAVEYLVGEEPRAERRASEPRRRVRNGVGKGLDPQLRNRAFCRRI